MELSIIIVNYNTKELTKQTIDSVKKTVINIEYEIFLVDNASVDGSIEFFKDIYESDNRVQLIFNNDNLGFAKANNIAIKKSKGRNILLLNSDTIVKEACIEKCLKYLNQQNDVGALGPKILLNNGELDHACKRGFPTPAASLYYMLKLDKLYPKNKKFGQYRMTYLDDNEIGEVDALTGAFMMVKREVIDKVGVLDDDFFMYAEDIDWCYRIKAAGWKIIYYPEAEMIHLKGQSSKKKRKYKTIYQFHKTMLQFYNKHYVKKYNFIVTGIVYIGIITKLTLSLMINFFKLSNIVENK